MILRNDNSLIGDFIGTIPAMIELAKQNGGLSVICSDSVVELLDMIPAKYNINRVKSDTWDKEFNLHAAFALADGARKLHMIQANYHFVGLPIPEGIPRPELETRFHLAEPCIDQFDYLISPFSRSLPENQKWQREKWQSLVNSMSGKKFGLLGTYPTDDPFFIYGPNVSPVFDLSFKMLAATMQKSKIISVVTGTSHLAYALNVKNYLFFNQGLWGKNPDAILFEKNIHDITVDEVINVLNNG